MSLLTQLSFFSVTQDTSAPVCEFLYQIQEGAFWKTAVLKYSADVFVKHEVM